MDFTYTIWNFPPFKHGIVDPSIKRGEKGIEKYYVRRV